MTEQLLFDIDQYKKGETIYQVRLCKSEVDEGEVIATFKNLDHVVLMKQLALGDKESLIVTEYEQGKGIVDIIGQIDGVIW